MVNGVGNRLNFLFIVYGPQLVTQLITQILIMIKRNHPLLDLVKSVCELDTIVPEMYLDCTE